MGMRNAPELPRFGCARLRRKVGANRRVENAVISASRDWPRRRERADIMTRVDWEIHGGVGVLRLVPLAEGKPPTFDEATLAQFEAGLGAAEEAARSGALRVMFVRSASAKFFCAGANLAALRTLSDETIGAWVAHGHRVFARLEDIPVPVVARVEGYALGGGLELALACDLIFASAAAQLGQTEAKLGFVAGWGGSWRLPRRVGLARAKELFFTGRMVPGEEAVRLRLVDFCGDTAALHAHCASFAAAVLAGSAVSHAEHKRLLQNAAAWSRAESATGETESSVTCLRSGDTQARLRAFFERGKAGPKAGA